MQLRVLFWNRRKYKYDYVIHELHRQRWYNFFQNSYVYKSEHCRILSKICQYVDRIGRVPTRLLVFFIEIFYLRDNIISDRECSSTISTMYFIIRKYKTKKRKAQAYQQYKYIKLNQDRYDRCRNSRSVWKCNWNDIKILHNNDMKNFDR